MKNEHLIKWLNGRRNYTIGVVLYGQFGNDESIKKILSAGKNAHSEKILLDAITSLTRDEEPKPPAPIVKSFEEMPDDENPVLQALKNKWMPLYTEMNYKRHALDQLLEDPFELSGYKRGQLARDILQLEQQAINIWQDRDHYLNHGSLPGSSINEEMVVDPVEAVKRIANLKIYIRRYEGKLQKRPGDARSAELLKQYQEELTELQKIHG